MILAFQIRGTVIVCVVVSHCFNLHFHDIQYGTSFHMCFCHVLHILISLFCIFFSEVLRSLALFYWGVCFLIVVRVLVCFGWLSFIRSGFCLYFLPVTVLSSHSFYIAFHRAHLLNFNKVWLINYLFYRRCLWCCISKIITIAKVIQVFSCVIF